MNQIDFQAEYNRNRNLSFLKSSFLPEDFCGDYENIDNLENVDSINSVTFLGKSPSLDLNVYEIEHQSEHDPRVTLTKSIFRLMKLYVSRRSLVFLVSKNSPKYRFSLVTLDFSIEDKKLKKEFSNPRRYSFLLGPGAKTHTPEQFIAKKGRIKDFDDLKSRFSIEIVNNEFYSEIAWLFTKLVGGTRGKGRQEETFKGSLVLPSTSDHQTKQEYAVKLIGRLVFCWFLKKKCSENGLALLPEEILSTNAVEKNKQFYHQVLEPLFFEVLNTPIESRGKKYSGSPWNQIPFLNGGLFSPRHHDFYELGSIGVSNYLNTLKVPDDWLKELFAVFETFNFTIDENTTVDVELSIEPEMLGRIFENLLAEINPETGETARKATGSYYTPRPIVDYMVDESLKQYLLTKTKIAEDEIVSLLSYDDFEIDLNENEKDSVIDALDTIKIIDPACGSGAFPMGILQKMLLILQKIDPQSNVWLDKQISKIKNVELRKRTKERLAHENVNYIHKLGIIQNAIYGVDIQQIAVEISKLRFFLSLIVDEKVIDSKENRGVEPLPNLEFKIVCANSLIRLPGEKWTSKELFRSNEDIELLKNLREEYLSSYGEEKKKIEIEFKKVQDRMSIRSLDWISQEPQTISLSIWKPFSTEPCSWFDPDWMFGVKDGFDIAIANPPYITLSLGKGQKKFTKEMIEELNKIYEEVKEYKNNTFVYFIHLALGLLNNTGIISYIVPNVFLYNKNFSKIRNFVSSGSKIESIIDIKDKVFESAEIGGNCIFLSSKVLSEDYFIRTFIASDIRDFEHIKYEHINCNTYKKTKYNKFYLEKTKLDLLNRLDIDSLPLGSLSEFYNGIKTGDNNKFLSDSKVNNSYRLVYRGRDIHKYYFDKPSKYVLFNKDMLWSNCNEELLVKNPKILIRQTGDSLVSSFEEHGLFHMDTTHSLFDTKTNIRFLLALLNSKLFVWWHKTYTSEEGRAFAEVKISTLKEIPIKNTTKDQQQDFVEIVDKILAITKSSDYIENPAKKEEVKKYENQIDYMVYKLYGLTPEEIAIIEGDKK